MKFLEDNAGLYLPRLMVGKGALNRLPQALVSKGELGQFDYIKNLQALFIEGQLRFLKGKLFGGSRYLQHTKPTKACTARIFKNS